MSGVVKMFISGKMNEEASEVKRMATDPKYRYINIFRKNSTKQDII